MTEAFEKLVSLLDYPMFVVTTRAGDESAGCLVGFASQVSIRPPRFLVGLSKRNHTYRVAQRTDYLAVHLVAAAALRTRPPVRQRDRGSDRQIRALRMAFRPARVTDS